MTPSKADLQRFFKRYGAARVRLPKARGNIYECFVYQQVCVEARHAGFTVALQPAAGTFVFRASPGNIDRSYGYASLISPFTGNSYELHNGIELTGHSGMQHEVDILLLDSGSLATAMRGDPTSPSLAIECKDYSDASRLKGEVRKAVGTVTDFSQKAHPNSLSSRPQGCLHCGKGFTAFFVTSVSHGLRPDIERFLDTYDVEPCFGVAPQRQLKHLRSHLGNALRVL